MVAGEAACFRLCKVQSVRLYRVRRARAERAETIDFMRQHVA
jgi:hypothetical protein